MVCTNIGFCQVIDTCPGRFPSKITTASYAANHGNVGEELGSQSLAVPQNMDADAYVQAITENSDTGQSVLSDALSFAREEHAHLQEALNDPSALQSIMQQYADIHQTKLAFRKIIELLQPQVQDQSSIFGGSPWKSKLIACADDWFYPWFYGGAVAQEPRNDCLSIYHVVVNALKDVAPDSSGALPVTQLSAALGYLETLEDVRTLNNMTCAERSRLIELPSALESYSRTALQAAQAVSDTFPITDIPVSRSCNIVRSIGRPNLGEVAIELRARQNAGDSIVDVFVPFVVYCHDPIIKVFENTLSSALETSIGYYKALEYRTENGLWTAEELAPIEGGPLYGPGVIRELGVDGYIMRRACVSRRLVG